MRLRLQFADGSEDATTAFVVEPSYPPATDLIGSILVCCMATLVSAKSKHVAARMHVRPWTFQFQQDRIRFVEPTPRASAYPFDRRLALRAMRRLAAAAARRVGALWRAHCPAPVSSAMHNLATASP